MSVWAPCPRCGSLIDNSQRCPYCNGQPVEKAEEIRAETIKRLNRMIASLKLKGDFRRANILERFKQKYFRIDKP